jgi:uncharacterized protein
MINKIKYILTSLLLANVVLISSQDIPARPNPPRLVNDFAGFLNGSEIENLERKLISYDDTTSTQITVVIVQDLNGMDANMMAYKIGQEWGVGQKGKNNGVVLLIKPKTSNSRGYAAIGVGYGLEAVIPDALAKRIIENELIPRFKQQQFYEGIDATVDAIIKASKGEYKGDAKRKVSKQRSLFGLVVFGFVILIIISTIRKGNSNHHTMGRGGSRSDIPFWLLMGGIMGSSNKSGSSGWGSFSSGSGSFGGFGGGGFGGGGASGSW